MRRGGELEYEDKAMSLRYHLSKLGTVVMVNDILLNRPLRLRGGAIGFKAVLSINVSWGTEREREREEEEREGDESAPNQHHSDLAEGLRRRRDSLQGPSDLPLRHRRRRPRSPPHHRRALLSPRPQRRV